MMPIGWPARLGPHRRDVALAAALGLLAFAVRLLLLRSPPYGDETAHYTMARTLGFLDTSVHWIDVGRPFQLYPLTVARPVFAIAHWPGTWFGFTGFRVVGAAYASLVPALAFLLGRAHAVRRPAAAAAGALLAVHPTLVVWGSRIFPDSLMAALVLAALLAYQGQRIRWTAALLLLACLTKETAVPAAAGLALHALWQAWSVPRPADAPPAAPTAPRPSGRLPRRFEATAWLAAATALGTTGVLASYLIVPRLPGWGTGGTLAQAADQLTLWPWLVPVAVVALAARRMAAPGAALVALLAFYAAFVLARGGAVNAWYAILPAALAVLLAVALLDAGLRSPAWPRATALVAAAALALASTAAVVGTHHGAAVLHPTEPHTEPGLAQAAASARTESPWLVEAIAFHEARSPARVVSLDLGWFWIADPFSGRERTDFSYTNNHPDAAGIPLREIVDRAEAADLVWMQDWNGTFHQAFKATYADCLMFKADILAAYDLGACQGRFAGLQQRLLGAADEPAATP